MWLHVHPNWQTDFDSKKWVEENVFLLNENINVIYANEENEFIVPNIEKKGNYYVK